MREKNPVLLTRPEVLNSIFRERPKLLALGLGILGDSQASERVFQELLVALEQRPNRFSSEQELLDWAWDALRNRLLILLERGDGRQFALPNDLQDTLDADLRTRAHEDLKAQAEALEICLSDLPRWDRWVTHLYYTQHKGGLETARLINIKPDTLYRDLQRIYTGGTKCLLKRIAMGRNPLGHVGEKNAEFERLVIRYLDDELTEDDTLQLWQALGEDPDRMHQFNDIRVYSSLLRDSHLMGSIDPEAFTANHPPLNPRLARSLMFSFVTASVILGVMLITMALIKLKPGADEEPMAVFARMTGAKLVARKNPEFGEALDNKRYVLSQGSVQLRFATGAEVTIDSPAIFRIDSKNGMFLHDGILAANVPPTAHGFEVFTKSHTVRDLGTEFGVNVKDATGSVEIVVFQGEVDVLRSDTRIEALKGGEGIRILQDNTTESLSSLEQAYLYPASLPSSDNVSSRESLAANFSFEVGKLSRAPYAPLRYRDIPSHWTDGWFANGKWKKQVSLPTTVTAGTVVAAAYEGSDVLNPSDGTRCIFLNDAAVRQKITNLLPGSQYKLKFSVATPPADGAFADYKVGFLAGNTWVWAAQDSLPPGSGFTVKEYVLSLPENKITASKPIYLALSSERGLIYFDEIRLEPLFGGR